MLSRPRRGLRIGTACIAAVIVQFGWGAAAAAQSFVLPKECTSATGDEGDDPVVVIAKGSGEATFTNFVLLRFVNPISWGISISPFVADTYNIITTYTPFLTSDRLLQLNRNLPSLIVPLPAPGATSGRETAIYGTFVVTIMDKAGKDAVPNAFVDFIPDFVGSSPLEMQADSSGKITLNCVQQNFQGYNITVYDAGHQYLYDGSFPADASSVATAVEGEGSSAVVGSRSRPHPEASQ